MMSRFLVATSVLLFASAADAHYEPELTRVSVHNQGNLQLCLNNIGEYGRDSTSDPLTGEFVRYAAFPRGGSLYYFLAPYLTIGAIVNRDTLHDWSEFSPQRPPFNDFVYQTHDPRKDYYSPDARSDLDILCWFTDTVQSAYHTGPPLGLEISQRSMAWAAANLGNFVLFDLEIRNVGSQRLRQGFVGFRFFNDVYYGGNENGNDDGLIGYLAGDPTRSQCPSPRRFAMAYSMDNDGNPVSNGWTTSSPRGALGLLLLGISGDTLRPTFNWLASRVDGRYFEPTRIGNRSSLEYRGDAYQYFLAANGEADYDQMRAAADHSADGYRPAIPFCQDIADGLFIQGVLSTGPFELAPGQTMKFAFAIVAGDSVHVNPNDFENLFDPQYPYWYYSSLDFSRLATNARWAGWVYDNPGVDSDGDGYFGKFTMCDGDTFWYEGDGVPDWKADVPPPAPLVRVLPENGKLTIRWNGYYSQTTPDPFTKVKDFEGYRVYMGLDTRLSSLSLLSSWDADNYQRYKLIQLQNGNWEWKATELPLTLDSLRILYDDPDFEPTIYTREHPLIINDTLYRFEAQDYNQSSLTRPDGIRKVYPDAVLPPDDTTQWTADMLTTEHGRALPKYYDYEYSIDNLLPTVEYQVVVTAFDFGFALGGLPAQESSKLNNMIAAYALPTSEAVSADKLTVYIWPNPYRYDGNYLEQGFENHDQSLWYDRARRIHFGNLPARCTISILSLDGDLIKEIHHTFAPDDPEAQHDSFDLISRAGLLVVSGIYYWVVEGDGRTQMGKLVIIE